MTPRLGSELNFERYLLMKPKLVAALAAGLFFGSFLVSSPASAQEHTGPKILVEKKTTSLPAGPLFWRMENYPTLAQAQAAAGPTGLAAEAAGKIWLMTLGPAGQTSKDGTKVAEIGPLPAVTAPQYVLQLREANNKPGTSSTVHTHPGSEAFYILAGEHTLKTAKGPTRTAAGRSVIGPEAGTAMQASNEGTTDLHTLVLFVLDSAKPFSSPAKFP